RIHLIETYSRFEPPHHCGGTIVCAKNKFASRGGRELIIKRRPEFLGNGKFKIGRHHADDGGGLAINSNALSDDVWIGGEIASPDFVPQNCDFFRAGLV